MLSQLDTDVAPGARECLREGILGGKSNDLPFGDPLSEPEYRRSRFHREHAAPRGIYCALRAKFDKAITRAIGTASGSRQEFPGASGPELSQPAVTLEFVGHAPDVHVGASMAHVVHSSGQPVQRYQQVTVEFELLDYVGD